MTVLPASVVAATVSFIVLCVASDLRTLRIPNVLTGPAMLIGLGLNTWHFGSAGLLASLAGLVLAILLLLGPFALGGVGGGDVKMMAAVGALIGPRLLAWSLGGGLVLGGVFMVVHLARRAALGATLMRTGNMFANALLSRSVDPLRVSATGPGAIVLPYSLPLGLGTFGVLALVLAGRS